MTNKTICPIIYLSTKQKEKTKMNTVEFQNKKENGEIETINLEIPQNVIDEMRSYGWL